MCVCMYIVIKSYFGLENIVNSENVLFQLFYLDINLF